MPIQVGLFDGFFVQYFWEDEDIQFSYKKLSTEQRIKKTDS